MRRNLDRRIEVLVPVERSRLISHIRDQVLEPYFKDNTNAWDMQPDGSYIRRTPEGKRFSVQEYFQDHPTTKLLYPNEVDG